MHVPYCVKKFRDIKIKSVCASATHSCAISDSNTLYTWGSPGHGHTGLKHCNNIQATPVETWRTRHKAVTKVVCSPTMTVCLCEEQEEQDRFNPSVEEVVPYLSERKREVEDGKQAQKGNNNFALFSQLLVLIIVSFIALAWFLRFISSSSVKSSDPAMFD